MLSRVVLPLGLAFAVLAGWSAAGHFKMTTDTEQLISADLPWRQTGIAFEKAFPQLADTTIAVIDGRTPEQAEQGASTLANKQQTQKNQNQKKNHPDNRQNKNHERHLLLSEKVVTDTTAQLI